MFNQYPPVKWRREGEERLGRAIENAGRKERKSI